MVMVWLGIHENITPGRWPINGGMEESRPGRRRDGRGGSGDKMETDRCPVPCSGVGVLARRNNESTIINVVKIRVG